MRKVEKIIALAKAGLPTNEIVEQVGSSINSVKSVCSQARAAGEDIPYEWERRKWLSEKTVVTLSDKQVEQIKKLTGLTAQTFVKTVINELAATGKCEISGDVVKALAEREQALGAPAEWQRNPPKGNAEGEAKSLTDDNAIKRSKVTISYMLRQ
jgi:transposase